MLSYLLTVAITFIALFQLAKDWRAHQSTWRRGALLGLIVLFGVGTAINNHYTSQRAATQHTNDQAEIKDLFNSH